MPDGTQLDLVALADEICRRYREEFPDEQGRYGDAGKAWCRHDNQHILNWAVLTLRYSTNFENQLAWLARVLEVRDFPLDRLARNLDIAAEVVVERTRFRSSDGLVAELRGGAGFIRSKETFLDD